MEDDVPNPDPDLRWFDERPPGEPVLVVAYEGWNDAGDAASTALRYVRDHFGATPVAELDPERFYDFTTARPEIQLDEEGTRELVWPTNEILWSALPDGRPDMLSLVAPEPQLLWRTYFSQFKYVAEVCGVKKVVLLGALLADVPHTRPVEIFAAHHEADEIVVVPGSAPSRYEGPTGILGVLHDGFQQAGMHTVSLWATVPTYVSGASSPKAALALVERLTELLDIRLGTTDLELAAAAYEREVSELVAEDEDTAEYVARLEEEHDAGDGPVDPARLVAEVENFLRNQTD